LSDAHLSEILIGSENRRAKNNAVDLSRDLLNEFGSLENLVHRTVNEMCQAKNIGAAKAEKIKVVLETGKRMASKLSSIKIKLKIYSLGSQTAIY